MKIDEMRACDTWDSGPNFYSLKNGCPIDAMSFHANPALNRKRGSSPWKHGAEDMDCERENASFCFLLDLTLLAPVTRCE